MATQREREAARQASEDGDSMADRELADMAEEDGLVSVKKPRRGDWVVIFTGAFFHCGQLLGEDHEFYFLAPGSAQIFNTGPFGRFFKEGTAEESEIIETWANIRKGVITHVTDWPHKKVCTSRT